MLRAVPYAACRRQLLEEAEGHNAMAEGEAMAEGRQAIQGLWRLLAALARAPVEALAQAHRGPAGWQLALPSRTEHNTSLTM